MRVRSDQGHRTTVTPHSCSSRAGQREKGRVMCEQDIAEQTAMSVAQCFSWNLPFITENPTQKSVEINF